MQNLLRKFAERRDDIQRISKKIAEVTQNGIELRVFSKELIEKEATLVESEKKYRALATLIECIVDNIPDYIWAKDLEHRYLFSNKALRVLFHVESRDALLGKTEEMLIADKIASGCLIEIQDIIAEKTGWTNRSDIYIKKVSYNGVVFVWKVHKAVLKDDQQKIIGTVSIAHDITDKYKEVV